MGALADAAQILPGINTVVVAVRPTEAKSIAAHGMGRGRNGGWSIDGQQGCYFGLTGFAATLLAFTVATGAGAGVAQPGKTPDALVAVLPVNLQPFAFRDENPHFSRSHGVAGEFLVRGFVCPVFFAEKSNAFVAHDLIVEIPPTAEWMQKKEVAKQWGEEKNFSVRYDHPDAMADPYFIPHREKIAAQERRQAQQRIFLRNQTLGLLFVGVVILLWRLLHTHPGWIFPQGWWRW